MAKHSERLGETPLREGVRREAGMDDRHRAREPRADKVRVIFTELTAGQHSFIDDIAGGKGTYVASASSVFHMLADAIELTFKVPLFDVFITGDEYLADEGFALRCRFTQASGFDRHIPDVHQAARLFFDFQRDI